MRVYRRRLAANARAQHKEMKKRSTDFDASAYGWAMDAEHAARKAVPAVTRTRPRRRSRAQSTGDCEGLAMVV